MKFRNKLYIFVVIIFLAGLTVFFIFRQDPAIKSISRFLDTLISSTDSVNYEYLARHLHNHAFISTVRADQVFTEYKITEKGKKDRDKIKIWVSLSSPDYSIDVSFSLNKLENIWYITSLPNTTLIPATVPLEIIKKDKKATLYILDVNGTHLHCTLPNNKNNFSVGDPISVTLIEDYIVKYNHLIPVHLNKIMSLSTSYLEDSLLGIIPVVNPLPIYDNSEGIPRHLAKDSIPVGTQDIIVYHSTAEQQEGIMVFINRNKFYRNNVRIVLNNTGYESLYHKEIRLTSTQDFVVKSLIDQVEYLISKDEEVLFKLDELENIVVSHQGKIIDYSPQRWYITPQEHEAIIITNINRSHTSHTSGTPYKGILEISVGAQGLVIVNEIPLEKYLYSVVPSEMPVRFGLESLKVQAIAARSYAVRCFESVGFASLGAHMDDSVSSQVYNNTWEHPIAIQAVDQTQGLVPFWGDKVVDARFFSTSCGYTANFHEVWSTDGRFPGDELPYLIARPQFKGDAPSLYNEENFRTFIQQKEIQGYDQFSPFFRWSLTIDRLQLEAVITKNLSILQQEQPLFALTREINSTFVQREIPEDIGELQNLMVVARGEGGNAKELEITTTSGIYRIYKEYNIRRILKPINLLPEGKDIVLRRYDGSTMSNFPILPSAFAYIDLTRDQAGQICDITISGGGYGHGVGMSQYGVYGLTLLGKPYREILEHFYPGSRLRSVY